jgi:ribonucleoside-diphosphate reductase beta chain
MSDIIKKRIYNDEGNRNNPRIINGNPTNIREWARASYKWTNSLWKVMLNNFWQSSEVNLVDDAKQFELLSDTERRAFDKIISFLTFLDSIQGENLPNIGQYITAPEVTALLNVHAFQEEVHAESYSTILEAVCSPEAREKIYEEPFNDPHLKARNKFIADRYQEFLDEPNDRNLVKTVMANILLEGIYFYSGFSFFYTLARQGKMSGTASMISFIQKDENTHLALFTHIFKEIRNENPHLFDEDMLYELFVMAKTAVEHEIAWGKYVTNNQILGLTNELIEKYIKYLGNQRMASLNLELLYPEVTENPMKWVDSFANVNDQKTDFFEARVKSYQKANLDFGDL